MTKKYRGGKRPASASRARRDIETRKVKRVKNKKCTIRIVFQQPQYRAFPMWNSLKNKIIFFLK